MYGINYYMKKLLYWSIVTLFWAGKFPYGPGTFGSLVSFWIFVFLLKIFSFSQIELSILIFTTLILALFCVKKYEEITQTHDDKSIVIDEFLWVFISLTLCLFFTDNLWFLWVSVVLFRIFDIWKPSYIGKIDREIPGPVGVIFDDILAGLISWIISIFVLFLITFVWK